MAFRWLKDNVGGAKAPKEKYSLEMLQYVPLLRHRMGHQRRGAARQSAACAVDFGGGGTLADGR